MSSPALGQTILVSLDDPAAARVMRAILGFIGEEFEFFFLLAHPGLADVLGETRHPHGFDVQACMLNPERFGLFISFDGLRAGGAGTASSWLVSYFDEIGIQSIEIQRELFQEGCYPLARESQRSGAFHHPVQGTVLWHYAAQTVLEWGGPNGIGYPYATAQGYQLPVRNDLVCVTSSLDHPLVTEKDRYTFAIAIVRAAKAHPELSFCWVVRGEEQRHESALPMLAMVADAALPNLWLESRESAQAVIGRARLGIAMPSTALLDHQRESKAVLLFDGPLFAALAGTTRAAPFSNHFELEAQLQQAISGSESASIELAIAEFAPEKLRSHIRSGLARRKLAGDWFQRAGRYLAQVSPVALPRHVGAGRDQPASPTSDLVVEKLNRIIERLGVIQRSSVGYKALKFMKRIKGEG